jgi:hypothetical protein
MNGWPLAWRGGMRCYVPLHIPFGRYHFDLTQMRQGLGNSPQGNPSRRFSVRCA